MIQSVLSSPHAPTRALASAEDEPSLVDMGHPAGTAMIAVGATATLGGLLDIGMRAAWMQPASRFAPAIVVGGLAAFAAGVGITLLSQP